MPANQIPQVLTDFRTYLGDRGEQWVGIASVEIPEIQMITADISLAGMAGKMSVPLTGQTDSIKITYSGPIATMQQIRASSPHAKLITSRGNIQIYDTVSGNYRDENITVITRCLATTLKIGDFKKEGTMEGSVAYEVDYLKVTIGGETALEIDKWNSIYVIDGVDYLADVRANT